MTELTTMNILVVTLVLYLIALVFSFKLHNKKILLGTIVLWFVPIFLVQNTFIVVFSIIMIIFTIIYSVLGKNESDEGW